MARRWTTTARRNRWRLLLPEGGEIVLAIGDASVLTLKNDQIQLRCGASTLTLTPAGITLTGGRIEVN